MKKHDSGVITRHLRTRNLSGGKLKKPVEIYKTDPLNGCFGNPKPQHFNARWAGWVPGTNKKGKPCKVWIKDRRPEFIRRQEETE
jgi:hypothetical protein